MRAITYMKILAVVLFSTVATLVAYSMDAAFWISGHLSAPSLSIKSSVDNRETTNVPQYDSRNKHPIAMGEIKNPYNAYVRLKLSFLAESTEGHPNLFQTAPFNRGMRLEILGSNATIIVPDLAEPSGLRGLTVTKSLKVGQWYQLEVEALNGAFVRVLLDAHPVFNYAGAGLSIETTELMVGGGFDASRNFRGQIKNISIIKGNLPQLPYQSLMLVYVILAALIAIFFFVLWKALGEYSAVQRVAGKIFILGFPLILLLGYFEYRLSFVNTLYYAKRVALEQQLDQIEVLVTGSSNTLYGVAPEVFSHKGFNLAFPANEMHSDAMLVQKYAEKIPHLRVVVLTVNFSTIVNDTRSSAQSWREFFLRQYWGIPTVPAAARPLDWEFWLDPRNFSRIALYGDQVKAYIDTDFLTPVDIITSSTGWLDSGDVNDPSPIFGINAAAGHNGGDIKNYDRNLGYWETLVPLLQKKNITAVIALLPTDISYYRHLDKAKIELMNHKLTDFARRHHIKYVDYTGDSRFTSDDFTWEMPDHINARGAKKLSMILDEEVIKPQW